MALDSGAIVATPSSWVTARTSSSALWAARPTACHLPSFRTSARRPVGRAAPEDA